MKVDYLIRIRCHQLVWPRLFANKRKQSKPFQLFSLMTERESNRKSPNIISKKEKRKSNFLPFPRALETTTPLFFSSLSWNRLQFVPGMSAAVANKARREKLTSLSKAGEKRFPIPGLENRSNKSNNTRACQCDVAPFPPVLCTSRQIYFHEKVKSSL